MSARQLIEAEIARLNDYFEPTGLPSTAHVHTRIAALEWVLSILTPPTADREAIARIIDPWPFKQCQWAIEQDNDDLLKAYIPHRDAALAKADAILAMLKSAPEPQDRTA